MAGHVVTISHTEHGGLEMIETLSSNTIHDSAFRAKFNSMEALIATLLAYASPKLHLFDSFIATVFTLDGEGMLALIVVQYFLMHCLLILIVVLILYL